MGRQVSPFKTYCLLLNKAVVCEGEKLVFLPCSEMCKHPASVLWFLLPAISLNTADDFFHWLGITWLSIFPELSWGFDSSSLNFGEKIVQNTICVNVSERRQCHGSGLADLPVAWGLGASPPPFSGTVCSKEREPREWLPGWSECMNSAKGCPSRPR